MKVKNIIDILQLKIREKTNPYFGPIRRIPLEKAGKENFTIISNNCWGGHLYRWYNKGYDSPTIGLYLFSDDYIKFIYNLSYYLEIQPRFISYKESRYKDILCKRGGKNVTCPIGVFDDIEVIFLHYNSNEEALNKWNRRKKRIHWDNLFFKMSEQNECSKDNLIAFDNLKTKKKIVFTHKDYGLASQIIFKEYLNDECVVNDTTHFNRYINLTRWLLQKEKYKRNQ